MSAFGNQVEVKDIERKLYTGVENFKIVAVNPTKEELEKMYDREIKFTPEYVATTKVTDGDGEREVAQIRFDLFLANEDNSITTKLQFYIADTYHKSSKGSFKVINSFGKSTWLPKEDITSGEPIARMPWYNIDGIKLAKRGEVELISSIVNALNLPMNLDKVEHVESAYARIDKAEWVKIFKGDVSLVRDILIKTNNKIGVLLGVKTKGDGKLVQATFNKTTLRQFTLSSTRKDKFKWILKDLKDAKAAGSFGNIDFGADDLELRQHVVTPSVISKENSSQVDVFASAESSPELESKQDEDWFN